MPGDPGTCRRGARAYTHAVDPSERSVTGEKIWTYPYADPMDVRTPLLAVCSGTLLVATSGCQSVSDPNGELLALDAATGELRWRAHTEAPDETLTVDAGVAVVAGQNAGWMAGTAFSIDTGKQLWERPQTMPAAGVATRRTLLLTKYDTVFRPVGAVTRSRGSFAALVRLRPDVDSPAVAAGLEPRYTLAALDELRAASASLG